MQSYGLQAFGVGSFIQHNSLGIHPSCFVYQLFIAEYYSMAWYVMMCLTPQPLKDIWIVSNF